MSAVTPARSSVLFVFAKHFTQLALCPLFRLHTIGLENLPERHSFVLLSKHQRWEDIPLLGLAVSRPLYYMAKYELFINPMLRWLLSSLGGIPLNRERPIESRHSLKIMMESLNKGEGLVIFPEGTYYKNRMGTGHIGLVRMIHLNMDTLFIPAGINYHRGGIRSNVLVSFGEPIKGKDYENSNELLNSIMEEISRLSGLQPLENSNEK